MGELRVFIGFEEHVVTPTHARSARDPTVQAAQPLHPL
jgi:hypothetical protein